AWGGATILSAAGAGLVRGRPGPDPGIPPRTRHWHCCPLTTRWGTGVTGSRRRVYSRFGGGAVGGGETLLDPDRRGSTRVARQRHRPGDGGGHHARRLRADPVARRAPRLGHLSAAGAAGGPAARPDPRARGGGRRRAVVGLLLLLALLQLLPRAAERDPQPAPLHGGRAGDQPPRQLDEDADRNRAQTREGDERPLFVLAPARGRRIGRRHLPRHRGAPGEPGAAQGG